MNLNFGIPLKRQKKEEKYNFPVLTMEKEPVLKKGARRFLLNKSAFELLGLNVDKSINETLSVGFPQQNNGKFVIAITTNNENIPDKFKYMLHKTENNFSDSLLYKSIKEQLNLNTSEDVEFKLNKTIDNIITFELLELESKENIHENISESHNNENVLIESINEKSEELELIL